MTDAATGERFLERVAEATQLREGPDGVADFLRTALQRQPAPLNEIARRLRLPLPVATALRRELEREGVLTREAGVALTAAGREMAETVFGFSPTPASDCSHCGGSGIASVDPALVAQLAALLEEAPPTRVELDQAPCTPETALRRAALMHHHGLLHGRNVLIVGDDDSVSLAAFLYLSSLGPVRAAPSAFTVLELDPARVAFLRHGAQRLGMALEVVEHDLRKPLPEDLIGRFDAFETDPPYTIDGMRLFVGRALEGLRVPGGKGLLSFGHQAPREQRALIGALFEMGFSMTRIHPDFNSYQGASILGARGQLLELEAVERHVDIGGAAYEGPLYTADRATRKRVYKCAGCGRTVTLGQGGAPATIEALKALGCPSCNEKTFHRQSGRSGEAGGKKPARKSGRRRKG